jgi:hypothetical protein
MMPPDYLGHLQDPTVTDVLLLMVKFNTIMIAYMAINVLYMVGFVWWLLFICRLLGIPWVDGTTKGFVNRVKEEK